jgi:hypothetical protein
VDKLYLVVREDLDPAQQAVQAAHALSQFFLDHPETAVSWATGSNTLALLSAPNEPALHRLVEQASQRDLRIALFREPDRGDEATALALEPRAKSLVRRCPLALRRDAQPLAG